MSDPLQQQLAVELRRLRKDAEARRRTEGRKGAARSVVANAADKLKWSRASFYRMEKGESAISPEDVAALAKFYGAGQETISRLTALAAATGGDNQQENWWDTLGGPSVPWFAAYLALESKATEIDMWYPSLPPGLFQTEAYALRVTPGLDPAKIQRDVEIRMRRQAILHRSRPVEVRAFVGEAALRQEVGDVNVRLEQLRHLLAVADLPSVTLRVVPFLSGAHPAMHGGPIVVLRGTDGLAMVYLETYGGAAWIGDPRGVAQHLELLDAVGSAALDEEHSRTFISAISWQEPV
jgi:hypothetical protein